MLLTADTAQEFDSVATALGQEQAFGFRLQSKQPEIDTEEALDQLTPHSMAARWGETHDVSARWRTCSSTIMTTRRCADAQS